MTFRKSIVISKMELLISWYWVCVCVVFVSLFFFSGFLQWFELLLSFFASSLSRMHSCGLQVSNNLTRIQLASPIKSDSIKCWRELRKNFSCGPKVPDKLVELWSSKNEVPQLRRPCSTLSLSYISESKDCSEQGFLERS